ncbi:MAG: VOC family protein [Acidimicrobiales bacterium]
MGVQLTEVCIDAVDVDLVARFWTEVLGWERITDEDGDVVLVDPSGVAGLAVLVLGVPESKSIKNRLHLDIRPRDSTQAEELDRLLALGATQVDVGRGDRT